MPSINNLIKLHMDKQSLKNEILEYYYISRILLQASIRKINKSMNYNITNDILKFVINECALHLKK